MPDIVSGFNMQAPVHIDNRCIKETVAERDNIPEGVRYEYLKVTCKDTGITYQLIGGITNDCWKAIESSTVGTGMHIGGCTWFVDIDSVVNSKGETCGKLVDCMTEEFAGAWFYAITSTSSAGMAVYPSKYTIDGANRYLSLRDYVVWTGDRLVHIPTFEAKASTVKNVDGKYSPKSGVDGLMSSTDKAYLSDLLAHWGKRYIPVYNTPTEVDAGWTSGYLVNWCRETGWYLGGFAKNCGGHPPVVNDNHTSWILLVLIGQVKDGVYPHALQVAFDLSNGLMYMRKGWLDENSAVSGWADSWTLGGGAGLSIKSIVESTEDGGSNVITFSDGKTLTVKNGSKGEQGATGATGAQGEKGADGYTPVKGVDYWTDADKAEIIQAVVDVLSGSVIGVVDTDNTIILTGALSNETYTIKYEMEDGSTIDIGELVLDSNDCCYITNTLTNCSNSNSATEVVKGESYSATISADDGYEISSITITMGGTDITSSVVSDGDISIAEVTGDIVITAVAEEAVEITNLLPLATDADGNLFVGTNGEAGYKTGYRLGISDGVEKELDGSEVTGFIPLSAGQMLYIKNVTMNFYDVDKNLLKGTTLTANEYVTETNGVYSTMTKYFTGAENTAYIRFCCAGITNETIVTVDQEIA